MKIRIALLLAFSPALPAQDDPARPVAQTAALTPAATAAQFQLPPGFRVELVVGEPDVVQPIAYTIDDRGRLWVLENTNYPESPGEAKDRILVLEDPDGNGTYDRRSVFWNQANFSSGIAVGFGGVWLGSPPNLLFIPDEDGDAVPDGPPQVMLDGWGAQDTHETLNNFIWGPDGWLYGTQGIFTESRVGAPGTPDAQRVPINAGIWRYHPQRKVFERWCEGVSNQWGLDWNDHGDAFFAACVVPHLWHAIEGAHYTRQAGGHFSPYVYEDIRTIAWGRYEKAAYCGAMIYLGGAFPDEWRNQFFFHDIHMNKLRCESLEPDGSGFRSVRKADFLTSADPWFRGLSPQYGPDGGVFVNDWYDRVPCHQQREFTDRTNGRMYKIVPAGSTPRRMDLTRATSAELVQLQLDRNDWYVRHARRLLQERGANPETTASLEEMLFHHPDDTRQLRALWVLHSQKTLSESTALTALSAKSPHVRGWAVTCVCEEGAPSAALRDRLVEMARNDPAPQVRLRIASAAQKWRPAERWPLLFALAGHAEDIGDQNLPLMLWYAAEGAVAGDPLRGVDLLEATAQPRLQRFISRRVVALAREKHAGATEAMDRLAQSLARATSEKRENILRGMLDGARGLSSLPEPKSWSAAYPLLKADEKVRQPALNLALLFGSATALEELRALLADSQANPGARLKALDALVARRDPASLDPLLGMAKSEGPLRLSAIRALASYDDPRIFTTVAGSYGTFSSDEKSAALGTLVARASTVKSLLAAFDSGTLPRQDLTAPLARLIQGLDSPDFNRWLDDHWGALQSTSAERQAEVERYRKFLSEDAILRADLKNGRAIFERTCSTCHTLSGKGGHIGPELPGNFKDLEYLLQNILDPNAAIGRDFQQTFITTKSGNVIAGAVTVEDASSVTLKTLADPVTVPKHEITKRELSPRSMMPEGLLNALQETEVRDLFLYLRQPPDTP